MKPLNVRQKFILLKFIENNFSESNKEVTLNDLNNIRDDYLLINANNVLALSIKDKSIKHFVIDFLKLDINKRPNLDYEKYKPNGYYTVEYINRIINLCLELEIEGVEIKSADDYPLTISTPYFEFILAPRSREVDN